MAIIPARGGSKGIPRKNLAPVCGLPLIAWSVKQAVATPGIESVWVSSDDEEILEVAHAHGGRPIRRPAELSGDSATSESAWTHALDVIESDTGPVDIIVGMQATSPVREPSDLTEALEIFQRDRLDSLFSCCVVQDYFTWERGSDGALAGVMHDYRNRRRRQTISDRFLENGSHFVFTPALLRSTNNRLGGRIGIQVMAKYKMFQIDDAEDIRICEALMRAFGLA